MAANRLSFGLLGPLQVSVNGSDLALGGPKQRLVLAGLLINRNRATAVDSLIATTWEGDPPSGAPANIHVYVSNLRRILGSAGIDAQSVLENRPPGYRLNADDAAVDVGRFLTANRAGIEAAAVRRFDDASRHLSAALREWRGPVLEDLRHAQFVDAFAVAMTEQKMATHAARAQAEIACGRAATLVSELEALVAENPYREPLWAQLMTAYYVARRQSDALNAYQRLKDTLSEGLRVEPNETVRELHRQILAQESLDVAGAAADTACATMATSVGFRPDSQSGLTASLDATSGERHSVEGPATSIGRHSSNDIAVRDTKMSRRHAIILNTGTGFVIYDTGSANGIRLNGQRITGSATLADGDNLRIGSSEFVFRLREGQF